MNRWLGWFGALALLACALPWSLNPGAGLSLNPIDLAEWTSLNPAVQAQTPTLLATFLLRTPLLIVALLFALATSRSARPLAVLLLLLLSAGQLPPFEFLGDLGNANFQQQALMAVLTLIIGLLTLMLFPHPRALLAGAIVALAGLLAAVIGAANAFAEMRAFGLPALIGPGLAIYSAALAGAATFPLLQAGIKKRRACTPPSVLV
ncbi:MAG TPA: hypothetical protein VER79_08685 [Candidatus Limnocylindrales bacterium]|nr:hypothetical protein [Candidatus Limnocylindrales bacterium]